MKLSSNAHVLVNHGKFNNKNVSSNISSIHHYSYKKTTEQINKLLPQNNDPVLSKKDTGNWSWKDVYEKDTDIFFDEPEEIEEELFFGFQIDEAEEAAPGGDGKADLEDASRRLTQWLVSSKTQFEVSLVIGEAHQHIGKLRMVMMSGDDESIKAANAIIRKLEKLVRRGNRKLRDLGQEDVMRREQKKAENDEKFHRAKQIELQLKRRIKERKKREEEYLNEKDDDDDDTIFDKLKSIKPSNHHTKLSAADEAKIKAEAEAQAAMEIAAGMSSSMDSGAGGSDAMSGIPGSSGAMGGEAVISGEADSGGNVDIAV